MNRPVMQGIANLRHLGVSEASQAKRLCGPPTGGISSRRQARHGIAGTRAQRTTNRWNCKHPGLGTGHRWHTGSADHQLVELMEPGLRGAAKFWGMILPRHRRIALPTSRKLRLMRRRPGRIGNLHPHMINNGSVFELELLDVLNIPGSVQRE